MCHIMVSRMKQTTIRELKHATTRVLAMVEAGETVEVRRRKKPVAVLSPPDRKAMMKKPDFAARLKAIYGDASLETTGTDLVNESRGER